jgi:Domain of unknown function (DUF4136)
MARITMCLVGALSLVACSTVPAMKVETDHDTAAATRLRSYRTYRVLPASTQGPVDDVAMGAAVVRSVDETLGGKGYQQEAGRPDFLVKWHASVESRQGTTATGTPVFRDVGPMPSAGTSSAPRTVTRTYREGTLILDVVDAGSDTVVWRGSARAELAGSGDPRSRDARIQDAVRRILERFPSQ